MNYKQMNERRVHEGANQPTPLIDPSNNGVPKFCLPDNLNFFTTIGHFIP